MKNESKNPIKIFEIDNRELWAKDVHHRSIGRMPDEWSCEYVSEAVSNYQKNRHIVKHSMEITANFLIELFRSSRYKKLESSYDTGLVLTGAGKRYAVDITLRELP